MDRQSRLPRESGDSGSEKYGAYGFGRRADGQRHREGNARHGDGVSHHQRKRGPHRGPFCASGQLDERRTAYRGADRRQMDRILIMTKLKLFLYKVAAFFASSAAQKALNTAAELVPKAIPYLDVAAEIAAGITPTSVDDAVLAQIHAKFPRMFDGSIKNID